MNKTYLIIEIVICIILQFINEVVTCETVTDEGFPKISLDLKPVRADKMPKVSPHSPMCNTGKI